MWYVRGRGTVCAGVPALTVPLYLRTLFVLPVLLSSFFLFHFFSFFQFLFIHCVDMCRYVVVMCGEQQLNSRNNVVRQQSKIAYYIIITTY